MEIEEQYQECRKWAQLFREAGYDVMFNYTGEAEPFDREWQIWTSFAQSSERVGTIDIDGCGASWNGDDALWLRVVGPKVGVTA